MKCYIKHLDLINDSLEVHPILNCFGIWNKTKFIFDSKMVNEFFGFNYVNSNSIITSRCSNVLLNELYEYFGFADFIDCKEIS